MTFQRVFEVYASRPCFGFRMPVSSDGEITAWSEDFSWVSYRQVHTLALSLARALSGELKLPKGSHIGLCAINSIEWFLGETACLLSPSLFVSVPIQHTLDEALIEYIVQTSGVCCVICSSDLLDTFLSIAGRVPTLTTIIYFPPTSPSLPLKGERETTGACAVHTLSSLVSLAPPCLIDDHSITSSENEDEGLFTVIFTSGSTGLPKGVMYSRRGRAILFSFCQLYFIIIFCRMA